MASRFWVGGTGSWDTSTTTHWSSTSGGSGGSSAPTVSDDVIIDGNSGSGVISVSGTGTCASFNSTGASVTFSLSNSIKALGNTIILGTNMVSIAWACTGAGTLTSNGHSIGNGTGTQFTVGTANNGTFLSGTYTLQDDLTIGGNGDISIGSGSGATTSFSANGHNVTCGHFSVTQGGTSTAVTMGSGLFTLTGSGTPWSVTAGTITGSTSTIKITDSTNSGATFAGNGATYGSIWFSRGTSTASNTISGSNTFSDFKDDGSSAHSILFTAGTTQTVSTFNVSGSAGKLITINSSSTAAHTLTAASGTISCDFLNIQHSVATGGASWFAGANSTNNQGVTTAGSGWIFASPILSVAFADLNTQGVRIF